MALGRADDASARLQTLADAQRDDDPSGAAITLVRMADLALADGRPDAARVHADAAVALAATGTFARERRDELRMQVRALHASGDRNVADHIAHFFRPRNSPLRALVSASRIARLVSSEDAMPLRFLGEVPSRSAFSVS